MKERDVTIDLIRSLACIAVVIMHTISSIWYPIPVKLLDINAYEKDLSDFLTSFTLFPLNSFHWYAISLLDAITRFSVPVFIMISGALVLSKDEIKIKYGFKKTWYIIKLIIIWGGLLSVMLFFVNHYIGDNRSITYYVQTIINGNGVFWFLYMLLPLYIAAPVFKAIVKDKNATILFVVVWAFLTILLQFTKSILPTLEDNIKFEYLTQFSIYSGFYVIGYLLYEKKRIGGGILHLSKKHSLILACSLGMASMIIITFVKPVGLYHNFASPFSVLWSICAFWLLVNTRIDGWLKTLFTWVAEYSMGIYALHTLFIKLFNSLLPFDSFITKGWPIYLLILWFLVFGFSCLFAWLYKKLPIVRKL